MDDDQQFTDYQQPIQQPAQQLIQQNIQQPLEQPLKIHSQKDVLQTHPQHQSPISSNNDQPINLSQVANIDAPLNVQEFDDVSLKKFGSQADVGQKGGNEENPNLNKFQSQYEGVKKEGKIDFWPEEKEGQMSEGLQISDNRSMSVNLSLFNENIQIEGTMEYQKYNNHQSQQEDENIQTFSKQENSKITKNEELIFENNDFISEEHKKDEKQPQLNSSEPEIKIDESPQANNIKENINTDKIYLQNENTDKIQNFEEKDHGNNEEVKRYEDEEDQFQFVQAEIRKDEQQLNEIVEENCRQKVVEEQDQYQVVEDIKEQQKIEEYPAKDEDKISSQQPPKFPVEQSPEQKSNEDNDLHSNLNIESEQAVQQPKETNQVEEDEDDDFGDFEQTQPQLEEQKQIVVDQEPAKSENIRSQVSNQGSELIENKLEVQLPTKNSQVITSKRTQIIQFMQKLPDYSFMFQNNFLEI